MPGMEQRFNREYLQGCRAVIGLVERCTQELWALEDQKKETDL